jgi:hypothetical protein
MKKFQQAGAAIAIFLLRWRSNLASLWSNIRGNVVAADMSPLLVIPKDI